MNDPTPVLIAIILILSASSIYTSLSFSANYDYCKADGEVKPCAPVEGYGYLTLVSMFVMILSALVLFRGRYKDLNILKRHAKSARKHDPEDFTWHKKKH